MLLLLVGGLGFMEAIGITNVRGTIIRLFSPEGTLVVEVDDPEVSIKIDGSDLVITGAGAKEIRLKPGNYTVEARKDGKVVRRELVTVTKNGRQVVRVSQEALPPDAKVGKAEKDPDRRAAEYVLSIGGRVRVNEEKRDRTAASLPREAFRLTCVWLVLNHQVSDAGLAHFTDCKNLTELRLQHTKASDAGLAHFKDCKNLTVLYLGETSVTDAGLAHFKDCKHLTDLALWNTQVSDVGFAHFKDCKDLTTLWLWDTQVSDQSLVYLKHCKNLADLRVSNTKVSDAGLTHFKDCRSLRELRLDGTQVSDAGLAHLKDCKNLGLLTLQKTKVTAGGIDELKKTLPRCRIEWDGGVIEPR